MRRLDEVRAAKQPIVRYGFEEHPDERREPRRAAAARGAEGRVGAMTRDEIAARVDELARRHEGPGFVAAVEGFAVGLDQEERDVLGAVLVERTGAFEAVAEERAQAKGWIRRTLDVDAHLDRRRRGGLDR